MKINTIPIVYFFQKNTFSTSRTTIQNRDNFPYMENNYNKWKKGR
jgi:hypothetical protein